MIIGSVYLIELGFQIRDLEAFIASGSLKKRDEPVPAVKNKPLSKKERIAQILAQSPEKTIKEIAHLADASYNYTYTLVTELRAGNGAELVSVSS